MSFAFIIESQLKALAFPNDDRSPERLLRSIFKVWVQELN
jgi:hypothetical protein